MCADAAGEREHYLIPLVYELTRHTRLGNL
jgi:hypothetical protein